MTATIAAARPARSDATAAGDGIAVAVFDLDQTITRADTFVRFLIGCLLRSPARWRHAPALAWAVLAYASGRRDNNWLKAFFLRRIVGGRSPARLQRFVDAYVEQVLARQLLPAALAEIGRLRRSGVGLVLATASPDLYVTPLGRRLGFDEIVCTRVGALADGRCSGRLDGDNCYGEEKKRRIETLLAARGVSLRDVAFYSDHHSDLPLLQAAGRPVAVNPTPKLAAYARTAGIPMLDWR
ncbi:MAG TPA: HAD family hydrolase [Burkholderiaceae bacterium]|jgi:phosphatidylglycerophosphatase C|nr:HAD family hydrolase [Burkholderiaceae bacterium]